MARTGNGLIAQKVGMTRIFDESGRVIPVTLLQVAEQKVTKILTEERDGYTGFQLGYYPKRKRTTKADRGRLQKAGISEFFARYREFRTEGKAELELGVEVTADMLSGVQWVDVTGLSKGRGFQGAVKRWGASIGRMSHGSRFHRRPGSLGQCTSPGRVFKGKPQPGRMGGVQHTIQNLRVVRLDKDRGLIAVKGSIPGHKSAYLEVRPASKKQAGGDA